MWVSWTRPQGQSAVYISEVDVLLLCQEAAILIVRWGLDGAGIRMGSCRPNEVQGQACSQVTGPSLALTLGGKQGAPSWLAFISGPLRGLLVGPGHGARDGH